MTAVWGLRLSWHLHRRNSKLPEDPRYAELAEADGRPFAQVALMRVFVPQGIAMWLVATPIMVGANNEDVVWWLVGLGLAVFTLGNVFEGVGDAQLAAFKSDPGQQGQDHGPGVCGATPATPTTSATRASGPASGSSPPAHGRAWPR